MFFLLNGSRRCVCVECHNTLLLYVAEYHDGRDAFTGSAALFSFSQKKYDRYILGNGRERQSSRWSKNILLWPNSYANHSPNTRVRCSRQAREALLSV